MKSVKSERDQQARNCAVVTQIKQLIDTSLISRPGGGTPYNFFIDDTKIKKLNIARDI